MIVAIEVTHYRFGIISCFLYTDIAALQPHYGNQRKKKKLASLPTHWNQFILYIVGIYILCSQVKTLQTRFRYFRNINKLICFIMTYLWCFLKCGWKTTCSFYNFPVSIARHQTQVCSNSMLTKLTKIVCLVQKRERLLWG